ncbi:MAG TPA: siderophore-interacting protein, partial [Terrimesophilobacter sp.]|nr:siderophore-interacting protein [Terrimesophilobacter sp.]
VDFVVHGDTGPATRWISSAAVGDDLLVIGPDVRTLVEADRSRIGGVEWNPGAAELVLLAGDETAAPAICSILESLPAEARGQAFIEVPTTGDVLPVPGPTGVAVTWLPRDAASQPHQGQLLDAAVRRWVGELNPGVAASPLAQLDEVDVDGEVLWEVPTTEPAQTLYSWLAGEAGCIKELRRFLVRDTGLDRSSVAFMGYWRLGRSEN